MEFKDIPDLCMIYITKTDFFRDGCCIYHVNRTVEETGRKVDNGVQEIYVNARVDDGSAISQLMQYMKNTRGEHPLFPKISARVKYLREEQEGVKEMCEAVERYAEERAEKKARETAKEHALRFLQNGVDFEIVAKSITLLTQKELEELREIS